MDNFKLDSVAQNSNAELGEPHQTDAGSTDLKIWESTDVPLIVGVERPGIKTSSRHQALHLEDLSRSATEKAAVIAASADFSRVDGLWAPHGIDLDRSAILMFLQKWHVNVTSQDVRLAKNPNKRIVVLMNAFSRYFMVFYLSIGMPSFLKPSPNDLFRLKLPANIMPVLTI